MKHGTRPVAHPAGVGRLLCYAAVAVFLSGCREVGWFAIATHTTTVDAVRSGAGVAR